ncbi:MAG: hypothetical protein GF355_17140 [Candidatus Eisenbacteria bacterium]|nr:hypothetical protein [Candidatus Eisenbacteria bacterium]
MDARITAFVKTAGAVLLLAGLVQTLDPQAAAASRDRFEGRRDYAAAYSFAVAAIADLDGDGFHDIVHAASYPQIKVRLNLGDGSFGVPAGYELPSCGQIAEIATADFDGDEDVDLALACNSGDDLMLVWNDGAGAFTDWTLYPNIVDAPRRVAAGDFNGDMLPDLALIATAHDSVAVYLNPGDGQLVLSGKYPAGIAEPGDLCVAVLAGDSHPDLVIGHRYDGDLAVLVNQGDGSFAPPDLYAVEQNPKAVAAGDVDGDLVTDIVCLNTDPALQPSETSGVAVLRGLPGGGFAAPSYTCFGAAGASLDLADLDGDGAPDLAVAEDPAGGGYPSIWYSLVNDGSGDFGPAVAHAAPAGARWIGAADLAGGAEAEVVLLSHEARVLSTFRNLGQGSFREAQRLRADLSTLDCDAADLDLDGDDDLVVAGAGGDHIRILHNDGQGDYTEGSIFPVTGRPQAVEAADYNGDTYPDIAATLGDGENRLVVFLNDDAGGFLAPATYFGGIDPSFPFPIDVDRDGDLDMAIHSFSFDYFHLLINDGAGGFEEWHRYHTGNTAWNLAVDDFDGDAWPDVACMGRTAGEDEVWVFVNDHAGGFVDPVKIPLTTGLGSGWWTLDAGDLNGDERPEILVSGPSNWYMLRILWNRGGLRFEESDPIDAGRYPKFVAAVDLTGDGAPEIVGSNEGASENIGIYDNLGGGQFAAGEFYGVWAGSGGFDVADLDRDGDRDIVVATEWGVSLLWNRLSETAGAPDVPRDVAATLRAAPVPFTDHVELSWQMPHAGPAQLEILDIRGAVVRRLTGGRRDGGLQRIVWDGRDDRGREVPGGVYFWRAGRASGSCGKVVRVR